MGSYYPARGVNGGFGVRGRVTALPTEEAAPEEAAPEEAAPPEEDRDFDPSEFTVEEVERYVAAHPGEASKVLSMEEGGKARTTLIEWLKGHID